MITLSSTTTKLQVILTAAKTTNDCECYASYYDVLSQTKNNDFSEYRRTETQVTTDGTNAKDLVSAPNQDRVRVIEHISVSNTDTAAKTAIVRVNFNGTTRQIAKYALNADQTLTWTRGAGWQVL